MTLFARLCFVASAFAILNGGDAARADVRLDPDSVTVPIPVVIGLDERQWRWSGYVRGSDGLIIDFVRADVTLIDASAGEYRVSIRAAADQPAVEAAMISHRIEADGQRVFDSYPTGLFPMWRDCLPPMDHHGDYWNHVVRYEIFVSVPIGAQVTVRTREGLVRDSRMLARSSRH